MDFIFGLSKYEHEAVARAEARAFLGVPPGTGVTLVGNLRGFAEEGFRIADSAAGT
jgi:hypothetical protein